MGLRKNGGGGVGEWQTARLAESDKLILFPLSFLGEWGMGVGVG